MSSFNPATDYIFHEFNFDAVNDIFIQKHTAGIISTEARSFYQLAAERLEIDAGVFTGFATLPNEAVILSQQENSLLLSCNCTAQKTKLCEHQAQVLYNIINRDEFRIFFDRTLRQAKLKQFAVAYGLQNEDNLAQYFTLTYSHKKAVISTRDASLMPVNDLTTAQLQEQLLLNKPYDLPEKINQATGTAMLVVLKQHKYYRHLLIELYEAGLTQAGKPKNPFNQLNPLEFVWKTNDALSLKFFSGITRFQSNHSANLSTSDIEGLKSILRNPLGLSFYLHSNELSENVGAGSVKLVDIGSAIHEFKISVDQQDSFHHISAQLTVEGKVYKLQELNFIFDCFLLLNGKLHLIGNLQLLKVIELLRTNNNVLKIHASRFTDFQQNILARLEDKVNINYHAIKQATPKQIIQYGFDKPLEKLIYLSDLESYVMINPVIRYGEVEIPILSKRQIYALDKQGKKFMVDRDTDAEDQFIGLIIRQHPDFEEQLTNSLLYFYLHKDRFLDEEWFLKTFEDWQYQGITVLGFNDLKNNKLNPHKAKVSISVTSGINWFNTDITVKYGKKRASLKQLQKAVLNQHKYVKLDDGTLGILPEEWLQKLAAYFNAGEVMEESLRTSKINFSAVDQLYEEAALDEKANHDLALLKARFADFKAIRKVTVPKELKATLRDYQKEGLNWLNFLDDFEFGGCLADDMGLGKSIQVIAFILSQREKVKNNTNLLVVPASLIFNWEAEIIKFAPSIKVLTIHGPQRTRNTTDFRDYEVILTTYGTLLQDISYLKSYIFNYVFADESQNIKNPESQRYKAVMLLQPRNRIAITGTPIENNTFDLYAQLSFACPGLIGSKQYFKDIYSTPIDRFYVNNRASELQQKVSPFILRRTKKQVARELPEKTEMVVYCEMGQEQKLVYDTYEKEFREYISAQDKDFVAKNSMHVLRGLTKLRQICNSPVLLNEEKTLTEASAKIDILIEQIGSKSPDHKILVFSQFVSMLDLIRTELQTRDIGFEYLTGKTRNREAVVNNFQENAAKRVILISLKAGGTGLNLTEADYVYIVDPWWNPAVENQAIDRSYRIGQKKNVVAIRLISPGTIEEKIMQLQETKKELADELIRPEKSFLKSLGQKELLRLIGK